MRPRSVRTGSAAAAALTFAFALAPPALAYQRPGRTERVNVASDGTEADNDVNFFALPAISADGRFVAFSTPATNLVPGDTNNVYDVFVRDRLASTTERVSVGPGGVQATGSSQWQSISADGRFVAFQSSAPNLVAGAAGLQIFVHDRQTGKTEVVSTTGDGTPGNAASYGSYGPSVSADGRFVVFASYATNLASGDTNNDFDVFIHDRQTGTTERVSTTPAGASGNGASLFPTISADGNFVAFTSAAMDLGPTDTNLTFDNYVWERSTRTMERASVAYDASEANNASANTPVLSGDGRFVAFQSMATNLVPADGNATSDIFVRDRVAGTTERVTVSAEGAEAGKDDFGPQAPAISADGRYVAFASPSTNLVPGDTNGVFDIFVHDQVTRATERVSVKSDGGQTAAASLYSPALSADGRYVAFYSFDASLVPGDTNGRQDVFVRDRGPAVGVGGVVAAMPADGLVSVSGWAGFSGAVLAEAADPAGDAGAAGRAAGADIRGASVVYRPETADLLARIRLAELPGVRMPGTGGAGWLTCLAVGCPPGAAGLPTVLYGLELSVDGIPYEVRAMRAAATASTPTAPSFGLYRCASTCTQVATLSGGFGTTGVEVVASVPLAALGASEGAMLLGLRAFTAVGEAATGAVSPLDEVALEGSTIPAPSVALGIAPAGTPEARVHFDAADALSNGAFTGSLPGPGPGDYEVWARACLGLACGSASTPTHLS